MKKVASTVRFKATLYTIKDWAVLSVPKEESLKLGSRGQVSVTVAINGHEFATVLEPDGRWSHWMRVTTDMMQQAYVQVGDTVQLEMVNQATWPEPRVPKDLKDALATAPQMVKDKWVDITPMARWEWIRWVNATLSQETRRVRIEKTIAKLNGKHRRPCCFNLAACTEPYVAKSGRLIEV